jgi:hypothetical protein
MIWKYKKIILNKKNLKFLKTQCLNTPLNKKKTIRYNSNSLAVLNNAF